jgi:photosystem II stability/assembly factor-like uncharacterized protein
MISRFIPFLIIIPVFLTPFFVPEAQEKNKKIIPALPSDWFFEQRAYPFGYVKGESYDLALREALYAREDARMASPGNWIFAGPLNIGGRITDVEAMPSNPNTILVGAASGGIFKSTDGGNNWNPVFDQSPALSIGDLAIAPSNNNIVYAGTGEPNNGRGSVTYDGQGIFKSIDGGNTWISVGLQNTKTTTRIAIHPTNPDIVYAGTMGELFANGNNRGLYKTTDGGLNWNQILYINDSTGISDVVIDPSNPNTVYASSWTRVRRYYYYNYGGPGSNIYKSTDGGTTWTMLTNGLPANQSNIGRIGIDISASNPNVLYAVYAQQYGAFYGMYKSTNGGTSWAPVSGNTTLQNTFTSGYFYWFGKVKVDPNNSNTVFVTDLSLWKTTDGGGSWTDVGSWMHVDQHSVYVQPGNSNFVLAGNDGGFYKSTNGGSTWTLTQNIPITQFYTCEVDYQNPSNIYGGTQDNGTNYTPTGGLNDWQNLFGGDGFYVLVDPNNPTYQIYEYQYGNLSTGMSGISGSERKNWNTPLVYNYQNTRSVFYGGQRVYKSFDRGYTWTPISLDLTGSSQSGNLVFHTLTSLSCSRADSNIIWAGCDNGRVQVTQNSGNTWSLVSTGLPQRWVTRVAADPVVNARAFVTLSGFRWNDYVPHVLMTNNFGTTWTDISSNLPQGPCNDIIIDPANNNTLYVATDFGVYFSTNLGGSWQPLGTGLPIVAVNDLVLHHPSRTLIAATYGRGQYKIDLNVALGFQTPEKTLTEIKIFPVPAHSFLDLNYEKKSDALSWSFYNLSGQVVLKTTGERARIENMTEGVYLVEIRDREEIIYSGKFVKVSR